jgi:hypothetical protein
MEMDWYCETYHCWMTRKACETRKRRAITGTYESRAPYANAGCGNCKQEGSMEKPMESPAAAPMRQAVIDAPESVLHEMRKVCTKCGEHKLIKYFSKSAKGKFGRQAACKQCCKKANAARWKKQKEALQPMAEALIDILDKDKKAVGIAVQKPENIAPLEKPAETLVPITTRGGHCETSPAIPYPETEASRSLVLALDMTEFPEIHKAVLDVAKDEFRTPEMQIMYWLAMHIFKNDIRQFNRN